MLKIGKNKNRQISEEEKQGKKSSTSLEIRKTQIRPHRLTKIKQSGHTGRL